MGQKKNKSKQQSQSLVLPTSVKVIGILAAGAIVAVVITLIANATYHGILKDRALTFAQAIRPEEVTQLADPATPNRQQVAETVNASLSELQAIYDDSRFVYLMGKQDDRTIIFLADTEPVSSEFYSELGEVYTDATTELRSTFSTGEAFVEGPVQDSYGLWYSAIAAIEDDDQVVGVVGIDVSAWTYIATILGLALIPLLSAIVLATAIYLYDRNRQKRLEALRFLSGIIDIAAHQLVTPIQSLRKSQETLLRQTPDEGAERSLVQSMLQQTVQLENTLGTIQQLDELQSGTLPDDTTSVDIAAIVHSAVEAQRIIAEQRSVQLVDQSWPDSAFIRGNAAFIERLFNGIVASGLNNTKDGGKIAFSYTERASNYQIVISNSALNLAPDQLDCLFDYVTRATKYTSKNKNHAGIGLFLVKAAVKHLGGTIQVQSGERPDSATVTIEFPLAKS